MPVAWITGNSGTGKSTAEAWLRGAGHLTLDADDEGLCRWVSRSTGEPVTDPPYPVPPGWLARFGWEIDRTKIEEIVERSGAQRVFLFGSAENEAAVRDLFDVIVCLIVDDETLRDRLATRTNKAFGQNPEELKAAMDWNPRMQSMYSRWGAVFVDGTQTIDRVADAIISAVQPTR
jgi:dephospho-CoA kinase